MQKVILYEYKKGTSTVVTPKKPIGIEYSISPYVRLVADEGKVLTNGGEPTTVIDVLDETGWQEIEYTFDFELYEGLTEEQIEYIKAGKILMGEDV